MKTEEFEIHFQREGWEEAGFAWEILSKIVHGTGHAATLEEAQEQIERVKSIAKVDAYYEGMKFRIVKVTREVVG